MEGCCSSCSHIFQPYKAEGCNCKYRTALSSNWYPQSLSFLRCNFDRTFLGILNPTTYLGKDSISDVYILKPKANCFSIKGLHHRRLYSKARELTLNGISKILWTGTISKIVFPIMQHTCNKFFFHVSSLFKQSFVYKIIRTVISWFSYQID